MSLSSLSKKKSASTKKHKNPHKIEKELIESQKMLQKIINGVPQHIFWKDKNSVFLGCNENFAKIIGLSSPKEIIGKTNFDFIDEKKANYFIEIDKKVMKENKSKYNMIESYKDTQGKQRWLNVNKIPLHDDDNKVIGILGTFDDITTQIELENKLKRNEEKYRSLIEASNTAYIIMDIKFKIIEANQIYIDLIGCKSQEEIKGRNPRSWIISKDITKFDNAFKEILNGEIINDLEIHLLNDKNELIYVTISGSIIENENKRIFCLIQNISNRKIVEAKKYIKQQKQKDRIKQNIIQIRGQLKRLQLNSN